MFFDISEDALFAYWFLLQTILAHKERSLPVAALSEQVPDCIIEWFEKQSAVFMAELLLILAAI